MTVQLTDNLPKVLESLLGLYGVGQPEAGFASAARSIADSIGAAAHAPLGQYVDMRDMQAAIAESHADKDDLVNRAVADSGNSTVVGRNRLSNQILDYNNRVRAIAAIGDTRFSGAALLATAHTVITNASRQVSADISAAREQAARIQPAPHVTQTHSGHPVSVRRRRRSRGRRRYRRVASRPNIPSSSDGTAGGAAVSAASYWADRNTPYVWGGGGIGGPTGGGFDCSGLTQYAIAQASHGRVILPRTTYEQIYSGVRVPIEDVRPGDLVFPAGSFSARGPEHVQLAAGHGMVIEAPHSGATVTMSRMPRQAVVVRVL